MSAPYQMSQLPSEIEALLRDVQRGDGRQHFTGKPQATLPYAQPGIVPQSRTDSNQQGLVGLHRSRHVSNIAMRHQPLYEFQDLQASGIPNSLSNGYKQDIRADPARKSVTASQVPPQMSLGQYLNTTSNCDAHTSSSPPTCPLSSPSLALTQRRNFQATHHARQLTPEERSVSAFPSYNQPQLHVQSKKLTLGHAPPMVQGIQLVSLKELPDRFRSVFPFQLFNAVQSKCYQTVLMSDENLIVSAPTGSGKTVILEMAICKLLLGFKSDQYKIVYMAPTKSLCSERQRDWQAKFASLDLQCAELTGDTDHAQLRHVQNASIIITTPEKWDSMTRKWRDHVRLMQLVKLFLIDEVHILKETRGATLEAVVSRMKSVESNVRFVALSATVPNSHDIAQWLGRDHTSQHSPAQRERFGEEFRPVKLQKFVYGLPYRGSDFGFETVCDPKLPEIISKHSHKKPMMVFCMTRKSCVSTAKLLANFWATKSPRDRPWPGPTFKIVIQDPELKGDPGVDAIRSELKLSGVLASGVAFHHAGLDLPDRHAVEKGFLEGQLYVICCTSTLAVGVNLPCHLVIIKNTMCFQDDGIKEYADLEIMQMLGRAGRPQYDDTAIAVILTKQEKARKYEKMLSGEEVLESCLHLNLIDHLNAEVGLGTIYDLHSAKRWLGGTFLAVRLGQNPDHYKLDGDSTSLTLDERIERICQRDLHLLSENNLLRSNGTEAKVKCTEFGDAMARYCIKFETMRILLSLGSKPKMSEILSALSQAEEYRDVRLKAGEKQLYKEINKANGIKFPIKVDLALHAHKRSLLIQAELGGVDFPTDEQYGKHKRQFNQDRAMVFSHVNRLIRCIVDCQLHLLDAVGARNALELARSLSARVWDNSPLQMKQIPQIGLAAIRKLAMGGINSIEALEITEPHRIETLLSKNPPFGQKLLANLKDFPKLRVSMRVMGREIKHKDSVKIKIKAECGFLNDRPPTLFHRRLIYVCLLVERSDGLLIDFRRISAKKLVNGQDILMSVPLTQHDQYIISHVMCDEVAGTLRYAELRHDLPVSVFPQPLSGIQTIGKGVANDHRYEAGGQCLPGSLPFPQKPAAPRDDEFADSDFDDQDFVALADANEGVDWSNGIIRHTSTKSKTTPVEAPQSASNETIWNPTQLDNGKWACNHKCKDKSACKHLCCREGVDKAPKPPKSSLAAAEPATDSQKAAKMPSNKLQGLTQSNLSKPKPNPDFTTQDIHVVDLGRGREQREYAKVAPRDYRKLHQLHEKINKGPPAPILSQIKPSFSVSNGAQPELSFLSRNKNTRGTATAPDDCEDDWMDDLPSTSDLLGKPTEAATQPVESSPNRSERSFEDDVSDIEAALVGMEDSTAITQGTEDSRNTALPQGDEDDEWAMYDIRKEREKDVGKHPPPADIARKRDVERLFLSTDSPEKIGKSTDERKNAVEGVIDNGMPSSDHTTKKRRITDSDEPFQSRFPDTVSQGASPNSSQTLDPPPLNAEQCLPPIQDGNALPPLPEWTKEIDSDFLAYFVREYGHLVDWWPEDTEML